MASDHLIDIIQPLPGIQRDGTPFSSKSCIDGQWCRWYRGYPKKIGGYNLINPGTTEIIRNLYEVSKQNSFDIYIGRPSTLNFANSTLSGIVAPEINRTPNNFVTNPDNIWTFDQYNNPALPDSIHLSSNPITTTVDTLIVKVTVPDSSIFHNGQTITITGSGPVGGLSVVQLNISAPLTIVDGTHISYDVTGDPATSSTTLGGNSVVLSYHQYVRYIIAHAAPNASDINNNVQTNIYWGDINSNTALTLMDSVNLPISSGGVIVNYPYVFMYGNDGTVSYTLTPNNWANAVNLSISGTKIVKGVLTRGGTNTPSILFFSLNGLYRATFQGGITAFAFDTIQSGISILSQNCVVSNYTVAYWIGINEFYLYNGIVRPLPNDMNKLYFFNNLNFQYRNKVCGWINELHNEIWWHYPSINSKENDSVIIFNWKEERWYDSILSRSAVYVPTSFPYPLLADSTAILNKYTPLTTITTSMADNILSSMAASPIITVTLGVKTNLQSGNIVTILGAIGFDGLTADNLNVTSAIVVTSSPNTPTVFTYTAAASATAGIDDQGGNAMFYSQSVPNQCYGIWQNEVDPKKMTLYGQSFAIQSYYETNIYTLFDKNPEVDRNLRIRRVEPDFVQVGNMDLIINYRSFAQSTIYSSDPYTFPAGPVDADLAKVDSTQMGRLVSFRFESNEVNGDFEAGKIIFSYAPGDVRP